MNPVDHPVEATEGLAAGQATPRPVGVRTPMGWLRFVARAPVLCLSTGTLWIVWLLTRPLGLVSRPLARRIHHGIVRIWGRVSCAILGIHVEVEGDPPQPPYFLASNHLSYVDIVVLFSHVEGYFLAKSEVASWPILGWLASTTGTLFVERARKSDLRRVVQLVGDLLDQGNGVIVFPEGTSTSGRNVFPFKASVFEAPARTEHPVRTASVSYHNPPGAPPAALSVCWWGDMGFLSHALCLLTLPSVRARVRFGQEAFFAQDRKELCALAQASVESLFQPSLEAAP